MQVNPVNGRSARCALAGKGIGYWEHVPEVLGIDAETDHRPCPFFGGWYQWMRNLVAALAMMKESGLPAAFVVVFADGPFPMARKVASTEWKQLTASAEGGTVPLRAVSYQQLLESARTAATPADRPIVAELNAWVERKMMVAAAERVP
jgi:hypothetical protein